MKQNFIEDNLVLLSKQTLETFLKQDNPSDLIGLYVFYYYTAKWQKTNLIRCTTNYVAKGLNWSKGKVIKNKKTLKSLGLIDDVKRKDDQGKIIGWYIKINYLWKQENVSKIVKNQRVEKIEGGYQKPEGGFTHRVEKIDTNALSDNSLNALSDNIEKKEKYIKRKSFHHLPKENELQESDFQEIAERYQVPVSFVISKWDDVLNYCHAKDKRYKDYRRVLAMWVKRDALKIKRDYEQKSTIAYYQE